ncbi:hypothetical protein V8B55DRAFT_1292878, partial [Mucor lusitanicus]
IVSHNIRSLRAHINQVTSDLFYLSASVVLLFSETTWTVSRSPETFDIRGFTMTARADNANSSIPSAIGACCYIKNSLLSQGGDIINDAIFLTEPNYSVSVALSSLSLDVYASIYAIPDTSVTLIMRALLFIVNRPYNDIVIGGDFNVDFGADSRHLVKKRSILQFMSDNGMKSPLNVAFTTQRGTFIDNIFCTALVIDSGTYVSFKSDHEPLFIK